MKRPQMLLMALAAVLAGVSNAGRAQDAARGAKQVAMCAGCHQIVGYQASFPQVYKVPMLVGQDAKYLSSALTQYRSGDRKHMTMRAIAASLSDQDIADIAAYYASLGRPAPEVPKTVQQPIARELQSKLASCQACHGANFSSPTDGTIARLAGQYADYMYFAMKAYQTEGNPHFGRVNAMMNPMVKPLTDADLREISTYLAGLPSELRTVPEPAFK